MGKSICGTACVSTHSRAKAAGKGFFLPDNSFSVSTHSRAKAAGWHKSSMRRLLLFQLTAARRRLVWFELKPFRAQGFNSQPREGGWRLQAYFALFQIVSTHSRAKAAGGGRLRDLPAMALVSTHSRAKAAGPAHLAACPLAPCFNSQPREGGWGVH